MSRLFFDHIPRTAGSAFCASLRAVLGAGGVVSGSVSGHLTSIFRRYASLPAICAAVVPLPGDELPADRLSVTMLREPVARCLSWYSFLRHDVLPVGDHAALIECCRASTLDELLEMAESPFAAHLRNWQAAHFAMLGWDGTSALDDDRRLALAKDALDRFHVVGTTEELGDFMDVVGARMGLGMLPEPAVSRASSHPLRPAVLDPGTLARLRSMNALDAELHRHAQALLVRARREAFRSLLAMSGRRPEEGTPQPPAAEQGAPGREIARPVLTEFAAGLHFAGAVGAIPAGATVAIEVEVRNESAELWPAGGECPVRLSYHWLDPAGNPVVFDGRRTPLPFDLGPGDSVRVSAAVEAPERAGRHVLRLSMVQEGVAWFDASGSAGPEAAVDVITRAASAS